MLKALVLMSAMMLAPLSSSYEPDKGTGGDAKPGETKPSDAKPSETKPSEKRTDGPTLPKDLFLTEAPADVKQVKATKPTLKVGDKAVLVGRIGGSKTPFVKDRAVFTLVDSALKYCGQGNKDDKCKYPWDYCCESRKDITANSVTIQVVDSEGKSIKLELNGVKGLKPLATVTVVGVVSKAEKDTCVVNATGIYIQP